MQVALRRSMITALKITGLPFDELRTNGPGTRSW